MSNIIGKGTIAKTEETPIGNQNLVQQNPQ
jgi:hypothetical protein